MSLKKVVICEDPKIQNAREARSRSRGRFRSRRSKSQIVFPTQEECQEKTMKRDRSLINLMRTGSRTSVRNLVRLFEMKVMSEGRKSQIVLLDERRLDIIIQPKLYTNELMDLVASHFKLKEKQYFGIAFIDETGHYNWLNLDKRVLDHDLPKRVGTNLLILHFSVRFFIETIGLLRDTSTVELFYLNARQAIFRGQIECDSETIFELAAHVLQEYHGDYISQEDTRLQLKKLPVIPTSCLQEHPSIAFCEDRVIHHYQKLLGTSRGLAIVNYMNIIERVPTYGIHYYEVKDKKDIPWWLGISTKGIAVFDKNDKTSPRKLFTWKQLENLYYRDRKFSIEVHDPKRVSVSRRTFGPSSVNVHAWLASTNQLTKCIWSMAVAQHQFYLERKQSKSLLPSARSMSEIAAELCRSTTSLPGSTGSDLSRSASSQSLPSLTTSRFDLNIEQSDSVKAQREMFEALKARKEALEEALRKKTEELKLLCFQEGELTGELPPDTPLAPGEKTPTFRRRIGTSFSLSARVVDTSDQNEDQLAKMELEYELQSKITSAAHRLAQDKSVSKSVRKQRRQSYNKAVLKLKDMEKKLTDLRKYAGRMGLRTPAPTYDDPCDSLTEDSVSQTDESDGEVTSPLQSPAIHRIQREEHHHPQHQVNMSDRPPLSTQSFQHHRNQSPSTDSHPPSNTVTLSPSHSSPQLSGGYLPSYALATRTQYRSQMYPTFTSRSHSSSSNQSEYDNMRTGGRLEGSQDSGFSSANNMYNITTQRTSHYDSADQIRTSNSSVNGPNENVFHNDSLNLPSKHGSLERAHRKQCVQKYNSLERNAKGDYYSKEECKVQELKPSRFGSKRQSETEYEVEKPCSSPPHMVEVPVHHERNQHADRTVVYGGHNQHYGGSVSMEPSPVVQSPNQERVEATGRSNSPQFYSPRGYEGSYSWTERSVRSPTGYEHNVNVQRVESPSSTTPPTPQASTLVTVTRLQPHMEMTKPYEIADFYKYSERLRKQRLIDRYQKQLLGTDRLSRCSTPSQHSSDNESSHSGSTTYQGVPHSPQYPTYGLPHSPLYGSPQSPVYGSPQSPSYGLPQPGYSQPLSPQGSREETSSYHSMKSHGPGMQYSVQSVSSYKTQHIQSAARHTTYQPLQRMTCEPLKPVSRPSDSGYRGPSPVDTPSEPDGQRSRDSFTLDGGESLAKAFTDEMLAWYDGHDTKPPALV
ncbi:FERM domain-containing protein 4B-like isoform X3 [Gigantopelta aegis]|uniref:FERM domain-containing protein 4B-like isoform X3 n=1 Tax=Gigantopelta aegis TaxID=1735272 RepID=UPI001B88BC75|nr:FERM domain-containing protein 4B-like isoform X3 [Gigantopelta aegis]